MNAEHERCEQFPRERMRKAEFPKDPQERVGILLKTFNGTPKALAMLLIPETGEIRATELEAKFTDILSGSLMEDIGIATVRSYIEANLLPVGFVSERTLNGKRGRIMGETYYARTPDGNKYAIPAASLALEYEMNHKVSLRKILGSTSSPSKDGISAPLTRARILLLLNDEDRRFRRIDISRILSIPTSAVASALEGLRAANLIDYSSVDRSKKAYVTFEIDQKTQPPFSRRKSRRDELVKICLSLAAHDIPITTASISEALGDEFKKKWKTEEDFYKYVWNTINIFYRRHFLSKIGFIGNKHYSQATITKQGRDMTHELLIPLLFLALDNKTDENFDPAVVTRVANNLGAYAENSANLYFPNSSNRIGKEASDFTDLISTLQSNKNGISITDISKKLGISRGTVRRYLRAVGTLYPLRSDLRGAVMTHAIDFTSQPSTSKKIPEHIKKVLEKFNRNSHISLSDKVLLLTYSMWILYGSTSKAARALGISDQEMNTRLDKVFANQRLIEAYDLIYRQRPTTEDTN